MPSHPIRQLAVAVFVLGVVALGTPSHAQNHDPWDAAARGDLATLQQALASGVDPDAREPNGASPLIVAAMFGHADLVRVLIEHDADLNLRNNDGASALHVAALFGHPESVSLLLEAGAATDLPNNDDQTALDMVLAPWSIEVEGMYVFLDSIFQMNLDMERLKEKRPQVRSMLQAAS